MIPMRIVIIVILVFSIVLHAYMLYREIKFPPSYKLKRSNGMIHHPTYGDYPEKIKYQPGVNLMPGQEMEVYVNVPKELREIFNRRN